MLVVVDAAGRPVPGAEIRVEQTRHAFLFGCNIFKWQDERGDARLTADYRRRFAELLNYATLPFYWPFYEPQPGRPQHERARRVAQWCREQGIAVKGHPLMWNFVDPGWLPADPAETRRLQLARIDDCVQRFAGLVDRWDGTLGVRPGLGISETAFTPLMPSLLSRTTSGLALPRKMTTWYSAPRNSIRIGLAMPPILPQPFGSHKANP